MSARKPWFCTMSIHAGMTDWGNGTSVMLSVSTATRHQTVMMPTKPATPRISTMRRGIARLGVRYVRRKPRRRRLVAGGDAAVVRAAGTRSLISGARDKGRIHSFVGIDLAVDFPLLFPEGCRCLHVGVNPPVTAGGTHDRLGVAQAKYR